MENGQVIINIIDAVNGEIMMETYEVKEAVAYIREHAGIRQKEEHDWEHNQIDWTVLFPTNRLRDMPRTYISADEQAGGCPVRTAIKKRERAELNAAKEMVIWLRERLERHGFIGDRSGVWLYDRELTEAIGRGFGIEQHEVTAYQTAKAATLAEDMGFVTLTQPEEWEDGTLVRLTDKTKYSNGMLIVEAKRRARGEKPRPASRLWPHQASDVHHFCVKYGLSMPGAYSYKAGK
ncbi:MAG: hypothetical protein Unbinned4944contig1000_32 [Prokaryotic dsDNA virus sp.]|nr:MAG: hypothetical protein Unbinned4944contig1000_32 [Prokaryotic dsDNA virus sp.]